MRLRLGGGMEMSEDITGLIISVVITVIITMIVGEWFGRHEPIIHPEVKRSHVDNYLMGYGNYDPSDTDNLT